MPRARVCTYLATVGTLFRSRIMNQSHDLFALGIVNFDTRADLSLAEGKALAFRCPASIYLSINCWNKTTGRLQRCCKTSIRIFIAVTELPPRSRHLITFKFNAASSYIRMLAWVPDRHPPLWLLAGRTPPLDFICTRSSGRPRRVLVRTLHGAATLNSNTVNQRPLLSRRVTVVCLTSVTSSKPGVCDVCDMNALAKSPLEFGLPNDVLLWPHT